MTDYTELKRLAGSIHGSGSTMQMLARWREFEHACEPKLILALIAENEAFEDGMRSLASTLGAGGYNAVTLSAAQLVDKVQWGVNHLADASGRLADDLRAEVDRLKVENEALLAALNGMTSMYGFCWDLVDGGLLCMQDNVKRFEDAHEAAQKVIAAMGKGEKS